jgi:aspartate racemase
MKTVGIIGGIGPESTVEYYKFIVAEFRARTGSDHYPPIIINSVDLTALVDMFEANDHDSVVAYLVRAIERLVRAGADFAVLAANTPHIVFDRLHAGVAIPMLSIIEATCDAAAALGVTRVGLLGTRFTMQGSIYRDVFARRGIAVVAPAPDEQAYIHEKYMGELVKGVFLSETRARLVAIIGGLVERHQVGAIILGGTELPLILREAGDPIVPFLDTTMIHVRSIVTEMLRP